MILAWNWATFWGSFAISLAVSFVIGLAFLGRR